MKKATPTKVVENLGPDPHSDEIVLGDALVTIWDALDVTHRPTIYAIIDRVMDEKRARLVVNELLEHGDGDDLALHIIRHFKLTF